MRVAHEAWAPTSRARAVWASMHRKRRSLIVPQKDDAVNEAKHHIDRLLAGCIG